MSDEIEFPDGLIAKEPHENAPDFVKAKLSIKRMDLMNWLANKDTDWINLDVKVAKSGKWYTSVDNWSPDQGDVNKRGAEKAKAAAAPPVDDLDSDVPF